MESKNSLIGRIASYGVMDRQLKPVEQWVSFFSLFLFSAVSMYNTMKVTPVLTGIGAAFGLDLAGVGILVTAFSVAGLVLAFPGTAIMRKFGVKSTLLFGAVITIVGIVIGLLAPSSGVMVLSRVLEGFAYGFAAVIVPSTIPRIFPVDKMSLPMGIWSLWPIPGLALAFFSSPLLFSAFGWQSIWVLSLVVTVAVTVFLFFGTKLPAIPENELVAGNAEKKRTFKHTHGAGAFAVALTMACWGMVYGAVNTYYPTFLNEVKGMSLMGASSIPLVLALVTAPFAIIFSKIVERFSIRKWLLAGGYVVIAALYATIAFGESGSVAESWVFAIALAACAGAVPMVTYALVPILAQEPRKSDYCMATLGFMLQLSSAVAGVFGAPISALGYYHASLFILVPLAVVGAVIAFVIPGDSKVLAEQAAEEAQVK